MPTLFDGELHVHYGQAYVFSGDDGDTGEMDSCFRGQSNGLLGAGQPGMLFLMTGLHTGHVHLQVIVEESERALEDEWEECVEASFVPTAADVRLVSWGGEAVCDLQLTQTAYRVRYEANGMDAAHEADTISTEKRRWTATASPSGPPRRQRTALSARRPRRAGTGTTTPRASRELARRRRASGGPSSPR